jgi:hypothetical protein
MFFIITTYLYISFDCDYECDDYGYDYDAAADAAGGSGDDGGGGGVIMYSSLTVLREFNSTILNFFA